MKGDFVRLSYEGKIKETGEIFDKGENIPIIIGEKFVIQGVEEVLENMKEGEEKEFDVPPEKAFGNRNPELIKLIPLSEFKRHNTKPYPGMVIRADNLYGKVLSVSSGRVKVDFNHPLAGKVLHYKVKIEKVIIDDKEKVEALIEFYTGEKDSAEVNIGERDVEIKTKKKLIPYIKEKISELVKKYLKKEEVKFVETF